ncbi:unnamed protein product [Mytilus coruscus]|uniref:EF-hand domain-containing protein n=1 Tax=Mytilus coruscus TaxID=42192 RepID=A0A6J8DDU3_MYTCO|nr:unnamed protein product [Mytilus coruscus]
MDFLKTKWSYWFTLLDVNNDGLITREDVCQTARVFSVEEHLDEASGKLAAKKISQCWEKYILKDKASLTNEDFLHRLENEYTDNQENFIAQMKAVIKDISEIVDTDNTESITLDNYVKALRTLFLNFYNISVGFFIQKSKLQLKEMDFLKTKWSYWFTLLDVNNDGLITREDVCQTARDFSVEEHLDEASGKLAAKKISQWWEKYILKDKASLTKEDFLHRLENEYTDNQENFIAQMKAVIKDISEIVDADKTKSITLDNYVKAFKVWGHENETLLERSFKLYNPINGAIPINQYEDDWVAFYSSADSSNTGPVLESFESGFLTFRQHCQSSINFLLSSDGHYLELKSIDNEHNHDTSEALFKQLSRERRLPKEMTEEAESLISLKVNKKLLRDHLEQKTGLIFISGTIVELLASEDNVLQGLFYQDKEMLQNFENYPEILFIDSTFKVNNLRMPLYVFLVEDSMGQSEVAGLCFLAAEEQQLVDHVGNLFKKFNPSY